MKLRWLALAIALYLVPDIGEAAVRFVATKPFAHQRYDRILGERVSKWAGFPAGPCQSVIQRLSVEVDRYQEEEKQLVSAIFLFGQDQMDGSLREILSQVQELSQQRSVPGRAESDPFTYSEAFDQLRGSLRVSSSQRAKLDEYFALQKKLERVEAHVRDLRARERLITDAYFDERGNYRTPGESEQVNCAELDPARSEPALCGIEACRIGRLSVAGECIWENLIDGNSCRTNQKKGPWGNCFEGRCLKCSHSDPEFHPAVVFSRPNTDNPCVDFLPCSCKSPNHRKGYRLPDFSACGHGSHGAQLNEKVCIAAQCIPIEEAVARVSEVKAESSDLLLGASCKGDQSFSSKSFYANLPELPEDILKIRCER